MSQVPNKGNEKPFKNQINEYFDHNYGHNPPPINEPSVDPNGSSFNLLGSPLKGYIDVISSSSEDSWVMGCICGNTQDDTDLVCCDKCNVWQHIACVGLDPLSLPDHYFCHSCSRDETTGEANNLQLNTYTVKKLSPFQNPTDFNENFKELPDNEINPNIDLVKMHSAQEVDTMQKNHDRPCDCLIKMSEILKSIDSTYDTSIYSPHTKNKNCQSFTLKNGQKILKSSRALVTGSFICDVKSDVHLLGNCSFTPSNYNAFSCFIYTLSIGEEADIMIDARSYNHVSRYIRRSCTPNAKLTCTSDPENYENVRVYLYSVKNIEIGQEITIGVDRSQSFFDKYPSTSGKHHWQKYDYSSVLICECNFPKSVTSNSDDPVDKVGGKHECPVSGIKKIMEVLKKSQKKSTEGNKSLSSTTDQADSSISDVEQSRDSRSIKHQTREEKKLSYLLKIINKLESSEKAEKRSKRIKEKRTQLSKKSEHEKFEDMLESSLKIECTENSAKDIVNLEFSSASLQHSDTSFSPPQKITESGPDEPPKVRKFESWYFPQELSDCIIENADSISKNLSMIEANIIKQNTRSRIPIVLARRRGVYNLAYPDLFRPIASKRKSSDIAEISSPVCRNPIQDPPRFPPRTSSQVNHPRMKQMFLLKEKYVWGKTDEEITASPNSITNHITPEIPAKMKKIIDTMDPTNVPKKSFETDHNYYCV